MADSGSNTAYDSDEGDENLEGDSDTVEGDVDVSNDDEEGDELVSGAFLTALGGAVRLGAGSYVQAALRAMRWAPVTSDFEQSKTEYRGLSIDPGGPRSTVEGLYESPLALFLYFCRRRMWQHIAFESNRYERQQRHTRAQALLTTQRHQQRQNETMGEVKARMRLAVPIEAFAIVQAVGLLLGNVLCSQMRGLVHNWRVATEGSLPVGSFGRVVAHNRF